jgi:hypothetical protein
MRVPFSAVATCAISALAACAGAPAGPLPLARMLADAPTTMPPRLTLDGDRIAGAAVPLGSGELPPAVRTIFDAIAPGGRTRFVGREWGERGTGYRLEKTYVDGTVTATRAVLASADGTVLERWHTVPTPEVPQNVLAAALQTGPTIEEARIVSGPAREEHWSVVVRDRIGRVHVARVGLDGAPLGSVRRLSADLDVASAR